MKVRIQKYTKQSALVIMDIFLVYLALFIGMLFRLAQSLQRKGHKLQGVGDYQN